MLQNLKSPTSSEFAHAQFVSEAATAGVAFHREEMAANPTLGRGVTHSGAGVLPGLLVLNVVGISKCCQNWRTNVIHTIHAFEMP